jgi:glycosyltransferase involved in cell wall biosynthesis
MSVYSEPLDWLSQSIDSILNQTFSDFEFIIINDNPEYKEGKDLLCEYQKKDKRIKLIFNELNIGLTKSLNKGLAIANGEYIARMDADDVSLPERFGKQLALFKCHQEVDICGSNARLIGEKKGIIKCPQNTDQIYFFLGNCIVHSTVMMKREVADLKYNESCWAAQDFELWFRAQQSGFTFYNIQEVLLLYRINANQITNKSKGKQGQVSTMVRRKSLNALLCSQGLQFKLENDSPVTLDFILNVFKHLSIAERPKKKLLYYLLLSVSNHNREVIPFLFRSGLITYLPISSTLRILLGTYDGASLF